MQGKLLVVTMQFRGFHEPTLDGKKIT